MALQLGYPLYAFLWRPSNPHPALETCCIELSQASARCSPPRQCQVCGTICNQHRVRIHRPRHSDLTDSLLLAASLPLNASSDILTRHLCCCQANYLEMRETACRGKSSNLACHSSTESAAHELDQQPTCAFYTQASPLRPCLPAYSVSTCRQHDRSASTC